MKIRFENHKKENGGYLSLQGEGQEVGRLTYTLQPEKHILVISYVLVYPQFEGKGYGKKLIEKAIAFAREHGWKIVPHCSYARSVMLRMSDIEEVFSP